ncbi:MAG: hypothetical protein AcusKO_16010 [Acuticoccus sp.]
MAMPVSSCAIAPGAALAINAKVVSNNASRLMTAPSVGRVNANARRREIQNARLGGDVSAGATPPRAASGPGTAHAHTNPARPAPCSEGAAQVERRHGSLSRQPALA